MAQNVERSAFSGGGDSSAGDRGGVSEALASFVTQADWAEATLVHPQESPRIAEQFGKPPAITGDMKPSDTSYVMAMSGKGPSRAAREAADEKVFANV